MIYIFVVCVFLAYIFIFVWPRRKSDNHLNRLSGPIGLPIIGSALLFMKPDEILNIISRLHRKYGQSFTMMVSRYKFIVTIEHKFIQYILTSNKIISKGDFYHVLDDWTGDGLLVSDGEKWRKRRKMITPSFHSSILEDYAHIIEDNGLLLISNLKQQLNKKSFNIHALMSLYTLDVICETAMGTSINAQKNPNQNEYVDAVKNLLKIAYAKLSKPQNHIKFYYNFTKTRQDEVKYSKLIQDFSKKVINERRETILNESKNSFSKKKRVSFLDNLLMSTIDGDSLSDSDIAEEVHTFMFEGNDTTAMSLSGALHSLANNPDIQQKVFDELKEIFGNDKDRPATTQDYHDMKYLELVIKETLRLYAIVPILGRQLTEDVEYEGKIIPKSTYLGINQFELHRDPIQFPDPYKFDPERFTSENNDKRHIFSYLPFSAGLRNCIGKKLAMMELKSCLSKIIRNFVLLPAVPAHVPILCWYGTLSSSNGMNVQIQERI